MVAGMASGFTVRNFTIPPCAQTIPGRDHPWDNRESLCRLGAELLDFRFPAVSEETLVRLAGQAADLMKETH